MADRIVVMYAGRVAETGARADIFRAPRHPYNQALMSVAMLGEQGEREEVVLEGDPLSPLDPPAGCRFHPRCPHAAELCAIEEPKLAGVGAGQLAACHLAAGRISDRRDKDEPPVG